MLIGEPQDQSARGVPEIPQHKLADLSALRVVLAGESVVDLPRLFFQDRQAVDTFLRTCGFDTDNPIDLAALREIHHDAVVYLAEQHNYRLPAQVEDLREIHDLFLLSASGAPRLRRYACMLLKVMHVMHHVAGRELVFNTPISEAQLLERLSARVFNVIDRMRASGVAVQEFAAGQKSRSSLVTKLLAKRSNLASQIFDKLRFRIVVASRDDLVGSVLYLVRNLFPFNYVIPEQSQNGIVTSEDVGRVLGLPVDLVQRYFDAAGSDASASQLVNEFSGRDYRSVNFVADIPLRIDDMAPNESPAIVFVQTEIQLIDGETEKNNNRGENSHALYKKRQLERVKRRLEGPKADAFGVVWDDEPTNGNGDSKRRQS
jgi:uncharacterized protein (TIGR04552 family)